MRQHTTSLFASNVTNECAIRQRAFAMGAREGPVLRACTRALKQRARSHSSSNAYASHRRDLRSASLSQRDERHRGECRYRTQAHRAACCDHAIVRERDDEEHALRGLGSLSCSLEDLFLSCSSLCSRTTRTLNRETCVEHKHVVCNPWTAFQRAFSEPKSITHFIKRCMHASYTHGVLIQRTQVIEED
jgi:hypothetical protein